MILVEICARKQLLIAGRNNMGEEGLRIGGKREEKANLSLLHNPPLQNLHQHLILILRPKLIL